MEAANRALALFEQLLANADGTKEDRVSRAKALHRRAWVLLEQAHEEQSCRQFEECIAELEQHTDDPIATAVYQASAHTMLANMLLDLGDLAKARRHYERGLELRQQAHQQTPDNLEVHIGVALSLEKFGRFKIQVGEKDDGYAMLREATERYRRLTVAQPNDSEVHLHYVRCLNSLVQQPRVSNEEADECLAKAVAITERFATRDPEHTIWERERLRQRFNQQQTQAARSEQTPERRRQEAIRQRDFLQAMQAALARRNADDPENYLWRADVANLMGRVAKAHVDLGRLGVEPAVNWGHAVALAQQSAKEYGVVMERSPDNVAYRNGYDYARWVESEAIFEHKGNIAGLRFAWAAAVDEMRYYGERLRRDPNNEFLLQEFRQAAMLRKGRMSVTTIDAALDAAPTANVGADFRPVLYFLTDVPLNASPPLRSNYRDAQKRLAPMARLLVERGQLSAEDQARVASLPKE